MWAVASAISAIIAWPHGRMATHGCDMWRKSCVVRCSFPAIVRGEELTAMPAACQRQGDDDALTALATRWPRMRWVIRNFLVTSR